MTQVPPVGIPVCYRHPGTETYVRCTRCNRPICPRCMNEAAVGHQCPECVAEGRRTQPSARTAFGGSEVGRRGFVTIGLIAINVLMLLLSVASAHNAGQALFGQSMGGLMGGSTPLLVRLGMIGQCHAGTQLVPCGVPDGEYYRLLTSMFMHLGALHLLMNMYALWILGRVLEQYFGPVRFLALYLVAGLGGSVSVYLFAPDGLTAGASGALFGLFAVLFVSLRRLGMSTSSVVPVILLNLVFTFGVPGISIAGHLGGLVTGAVVGTGLAYAPRQYRTQVQVATIVGVLVVLGIVTLVQTSMLKAA